MRIYKNSKTNSIVAVNLEKQLVSTVSSYPKSFFDFINNSHYSMFYYGTDKEIIKNRVRNHSVKEADEEKIIFMNYTNNDLSEFEVNTFAKKRKEDEEIFDFIGFASNYDELQIILNEVDILD